VKGGFRAQREALAEDQVLRPWHEYKEGLRYMKASPLILGISLVGVGWATGGGAAQILFTLFGEQVFNRGPAGIGMVWSFAGLGLLVGGGVGHYLGKRISFRNYKLAISICYVIHGGSYVLFSQAPRFGMALLFIALSRAGVSVSSVLNVSQMLRRVPDDYFDDNSGDRIAVRQPSNHRLGSRRAKLQHRALLGLGKLGGETPGARTPSNRRRGGGGPRRAKGVKVAVAG